MATKKKKQSAVTQAKLARSKPKVVSPPLPIPAATTVARDVSPRPQYICVSDQEQGLDAMVRMVAQVKRVTASANVIESAGVAVLETPPGEADIQIYSELGALAADLSPEERERLESAGAVITENEERSIPPNEDVHPVEPVTTEPRSPLPLKNPETILEAFIFGQMTALAQVYELSRRQRQTDTALRIGVAAVSALADAHSWCLSLVGLGPEFSGPTGRGIKVAVLDTGLDLRHPDFVARVRTENVQDFSGSSGPQDIQGHGTHCAGIIAGPRSSKSGIRYGIAPDVTLLVGKVLNDSGRGSDDSILSGMTWAARNGAQVISMSLGSPRDAGQPFSPVYERIASRLKGQNIVIVAAAGNESFRPSSIAPVGNPAACPSILAIGAMDRSKAVASFSCGGVDPIDCVNLAAPGVAVFSSLPVAKGSFGLKSGTSMATPYAAGALALYLEINSSDNVDALLGRVRTDGSRPERDFGRGLVLVP